MSSSRYWCLSCPFGQRIVQVENSHIILTGASALNKVSAWSGFIYVPWRVTSFVWIHF